MLSNRSYSRSVAACGLWLAVGASSVIAQPPDATINRTPEGGQAGVYGTYFATDASYPRVIHENKIASTSETMVYEGGEFKVVTQNSNDPKTNELSRQSIQVLSEAVQKLRSDSASEKERADAKQMMTQYLEAHFDHDQKKRREQLESLEAQVAKLKSQLEKRSQSKEQLIELRITILENDASGLSFPESWTQVPGVETPPKPLYYTGGAYPGAPVVPVYGPPGASALPGLPRVPAVSVQRIAPPVPISSPPSAIPTPTPAPAPAPAPPNR